MTRSASNCQCQPSANSDSIAVSGRSATQSAGDSQCDMADIVNKIPARPSLKKSCEKCRKRPDQNGKGFSFCASCKSHWKEHKRMCTTRIEHAEIERDLKAQAALSGWFFVSQATLRKWYYDNVAIVDYAVSSSSELLRQLILGLGSRIIILFIVNGSSSLMLIDSHDLPLDEDWDKMEKDETWNFAIGTNH
ncbi:hypothetical protein B0H14DRAFT_2561918 [Mycena olivaceomarginata]|nr:hypothetical protein B0H14DRAFT_2561918 [Mycena olivaceomarginata]